MYAYKWVGVSLLEAHDTTIDGWRLSISDSEYYRNDLHIKRVIRVTRNRKLQMTQNG